MKVINIVVNFFIYCSLIPVIIFILLYSISQKIATILTTFTRISNLNIQLYSLAQFQEKIRAVPI